MPVNLGDLIYDNGDSSYGIVISVLRDYQYGVVWFNSKVESSVETPDSLEDYEHYGKTSHEG